MAHQVREHVGIECKILLRHYLLNVVESFIHDVLRKFVIEVKCDCTG